MKRTLFFFSMALVFLFSLFTPIFGQTTAKAAAGTSYYKVTSATVSLRTSPNSKATAVESLKKGAILIRLDSKSYSGSKLTWYKVQVRSSGNIGYIASKYIAKTTLPDYSRIKNIAANTGVLTPAFKADTFQYNYYLAEGQNDFALSYSANAGAAVEIKVGDTPVAGNPASVAFQNGAVVTVTSTYEDKKSVYQITMKREDANASKLQSLSFDDVAISPEFNPDVVSYSASVPYATLETTAKLKKFNGDASINYYINGEKNEDGFLPIMIGKNTYAIECISPLGQKTVYTLDVTRAEPAQGEKKLMSALERRFVETAFQLLPERHPFVLAYEEATGRDIKTYSITKKGHKLSGLPFEFGGNGNFTGFSSRWWNATGVARYPVGGMDCAEYMHWIYRQLGYNVEDSSSGLFLSGVEGESRSIPGVRTHKVITSLNDAKIGDITYNSQEYTYRSGHGNHTSMFLGTARELGIEDTIRKYYRDFPVDAYLVVDIGWADGKYYNSLIKKTGVKGRDDLCGVGIQFFTSIKGNDGKYIYKSPYLSSKKSFSWKDSQSGQTFSVAANLERNKRPMQYKPSAKSKVNYVMNLSRPIHRND